MKSYISKVGKNWIVTSEDGKDLFSSIVYEEALAYWKGL